MILLYILSFLMTFYQNPALGSSVFQDSTVDWIAIFSSVDEKKVEDFRLTNSDKLIIPEEGPNHHQQGIQRLENGGWVVSGSGKQSGYVYFSHADGNIHTVFSLPNELEIEDINPKLDYNHPGGFQITNHILAIGLEHTRYRKNSHSRIIFLDVSNPKSPTHYSHLDIVREAEKGKVMTAGAVGIVELRDSYLILVGNWDSKRLDFYQSSSKNLADKNTSISTCLGSWTATQDFQAYQNINLYGSSLDKLYLIGMYSQNRVDDYADLFELDCSDWANIRVSKKAEKHFRNKGKAARFVHGGGTYYDSKGQRLSFFSVGAHMRGETVFCNYWRK